MKPERLAEICKRTANVCQHLEATKADGDSMYHCPACNGYMGRIPDESLMAELNDEVARLLGNPCCDEHPHGCHAENCAARATAELEPCGCPTPGACSAVDTIAALVFQRDELKRQLEKLQGERDEWKCEALDACWNCGLSAEDKP